MKTSSYTDLPDHCLVFLVGSHIDPPPDEEKDLSLEDAIPLTKPTDMSDAEVAQFLSFMRQTLRYDLATGLLLQSC